MRVKYNATPKCQLEFDCATPKEMVAQLGAFQELLMEPECGQCKSTQLRFEHRNAGGNDYYSMRCCACNAQLNLGQHKTGHTLFVKRDKGQRGWYHYSKESSGEGDYQ